MRKNIKQLVDWANELNTESLELQAEVTQAKNVADKAKARLDKINTEFKEYSKLTSLVRNYASAIIETDPTDLKKLDKIHDKYEKAIAKIVSKETSAQSSRNIVMDQITAGLDLIEGLKKNLETDSTSTDTADAQ